MGRRALFVAAVFRLKVTSNLGRGEKFFDDMFITNDPERIRTFVTPNLEAAIGGIETQALRSAHAIVYSQPEWLDESQDTPKALQALNSRLAKALLLLEALWLVRDNAAGVDMGFFVEPATRRMPEMIHSNSWSHFVTSCDGDRRTEMTVTREELNTARTFVTGMYDGELAKDVREAHAFHREAFRFTRAMFFVQGARATRDLTLKIANYCTALECLFANETGELTHRLGERLARFLETDVAPRKSVYASVKKAYDVRSRVVHGATPSAKFEALAATARECDELVRRALVKILSDKSLHRLFLGNESASHEFPDFLLDLVLS